MAYPAQLPEVRAKRDATMLKRYGVIHAGELYVERGLWQAKQDLLRTEHGLTVITSDWQGPTATYKFKHLCGYEFEDNLACGKIPRCWKCHPAGCSLGEQEVREYVESLGFKTSVLRTLQVPGHSFSKHLDIYIPEKSIAIEFNGDVVS